MESARRQRTLTRCVLLTMVANNSLDTTALKAAVASGVSSWGLDPWLAPL